MPQLGSEPPNPLPVDPNCPPHLLSDHTRERLGRNAPFFDFVNAPFTHPVGTQISVTCITSAWNAYDTFVNASISDLRTAFPNDRRVVLLNERIERNASPLGTDEKLDILEIAWTQRDYVNYVDATRPFKPEQVELLVQAGKDIRTAFTHRFGEPTARLKRMLREQSFEDLGFRMLNGEFEVTLWSARKMLEAIELRAVIVDQKKILWSCTRSKPATSDQ